MYAFELEIIKINKLIESHLIALGATWAWYKDRYDLALLILPLVINRDRFIACRSSFANMIEDHDVLNGRLPGTVERSNAVVQWN